MGTAADPLPQPEHLTSIIIDAIVAGYRHFDTAALYGTEEPLSSAVAEALKRGLIKNRDDVFITSKLWCSDADHDLVLPTLKKTLRKLGLSYVDLYLIHWPVRIKPGIDHFRFSKEDILPFDMKGTWKAMEECCKLGLAKSVGVSNFSCAKLEQLLQHATILPAVNQVEMNVAWQQQKMLEFCRKKGIHVSAWSPLGANGAYWGSDVVFSSPVLQQIAIARGKTVPQVALRWIYEERASIIVKSFNNERMKENLDILDWKLSEEEVKQIKQINQCRGFLGQLFLHENGPYKTLEQLWDGEI